MSAWLALSRIALVIIVLALAWLNCRSDPERPFPRFPLALFIAGSIGAAFAVLNG